jgi:hypothetical protein
MLDLQKLAEGFFPPLVIGKEKITALPPFDIDPVFPLERGDYRDRLPADPDLGRFGMRRPDSAYRRAVLPPPPGRLRVDHRDLEAFFRAVVGQGHADRPCPCYDYIEVSHTRPRWMAAVTSSAMPPSSPSASFTMALIGISTVRGRSEPGTIDFVSTPAARKTEG